MDIHAEIYAGYIAKHGIHSDETITMDERALKYIASLEKDEQEAFQGHRYINITEYYIPENDALYVLGRAVPVKSPISPGNIETLEIRKSMNDMMMYIADSSIRMRIINQSFWMYLKILGGFVLLAGCLYSIPFLT